VIFLSGGLVTEAQPKGKGATVTVAGLIIPRDNEGMYIRNDQGQFEVTWTSKTRVALVANTRLFNGLKGDRLAYKIHSSKEVVTFPVPKGPITGIKTSRGGGNNWREPSKRPRTRTGS